MDNFDYSKQAIKNIMDTDRFYMLSNMAKILYMAMLFHSTIGGSIKDIHLLGALLGLPKGSADLQETVEELVNANLIERRPPWLWIRDWPKIIDPEYSED